MDWLRKIDYHSIYKLQYDLSLLSLGKYIEFTSWEHPLYFRGEREKNHVAELRLEDFDPFCFCLEMSFYMIIFLTAASKEIANLVLNLRVRMLLKGPVLIVIIKSTISSIEIALETSYFPLIHLPSCYRTVFIGHFNKTITFEAVV